MSKVIKAQITENVLDSKIETSDRFVYSNYVVPFLLTFDDGRTPIVPFYVKQQLLELLTYGGLNRERLEVILREIKVPELWRANDMDAARAHLYKTSVGAMSSHLNPGGPVVPLAETGIDGVARDIQKVGGLLAALERLADGAGDEVLRLASGQLTKSVERLLEYTATSRRGGAAQPNVLGDQDAEIISGLLQSQIGYGFLDRTRISPVGFAIGEHVFALGLAPGEEVVLEQKTFTKRQATFEEQTDQERQLDIELSSSYSTELQEGFERQRSQTDQWGLNYSKTWSYTSPALSPYGQWAVNNNFNWTKNVTEANQEARRRSIRDNQQASSKISARYRTQHKTVFRVTAERSFETLSRRTIRNPNRATPITLHFFKVLQRLRLRQERYGVRLCWTPVVKAPALSFLGRIHAGRQKILDEAQARLPIPPKRPDPPSSDGSTTKREEKRFTSAVKVADQVNWTQGHNYDYEVNVDIPQGWTWDENVENVKIDLSASLRTPGTYSVTRIGIPVLRDGGLQVRVHVEAGDRPGAQPISFQVRVNCFKDTTVPAGAAQNVAYLAELEDWRSAVSRWESAKEEALAQANSAANAFEKDMLLQLSPVNELISQVIARWFSPSTRDEAWEIDFWQQLFEWERASVAAYPGWWSNEALRNPLRDPSDFINASWAKLYMPVRVGMEKNALRWIFGKALAQPLSAVVERRFDAIIEGLREFRVDLLGAANEVTDVTEPCQVAPEPFACLAEWTELMPAEGTHIEVVQGATSAADEATAAEIKAAAELRDALLESEKRNAQIKKKVVDQITDPVKVVVTVGTDGNGDTGGATP